MRAPRRRKALQARAVAPPERATCVTGRSNKGEAARPCASLTPPHVQAAARSALETHRQLARALRELAEEQEEGSQAEAQALAAARRAGEAHSSLEAAVRGAAARARRNADERARGALWGGLDKGKGDKGKDDASGAGAGDEDAKAAAAEATESLRRTRALMEEELAQGRATLAALTASTSTLTEAKGEFEGQAGLLTAGRRLLEWLRRANSSDRLMNLLAFGFFLCCAAHVVARRMGLWRLGRYVARKAAPVMGEDVRDAAAAIIGGEDDLLLDAAETALQHTSVGAEASEAAAECKADGAGDRKGTLACDTSAQASVGQVSPELAAELGVDGVDGGGGMHTEL